MKIFVTDWRMNKHRKIHDGLRLRSIVIISILVYLNPSRELGQVPSPFTDTEVKGQVGNQRYQIWMRVWGPIPSTP